MSLEWLGPDLIEVGVHIADVCAFVAHKSALDLEARQRGTTIYLPHERYNMLPSLLSSDIASLHAHKDRLTMSVLWHVRVVALESSKRGGVLPMDDILNLYTEGKLIFELPDTPEWIGRGVICSTAAATYLQAHYLMHENAPFSQKKREKEMEKEVPLGQAGRQIDRKHWSRLSSDLRCLTALGMHLQKGREAAGALDLSQGSGAELKFALDAEGAPVEVHGKEEMQIHKTISELMVLANATVAKFVFDFFPTSTLLRIHPPPSGDKLRLLHEEISQTGLEVFQQNASSTEMRQQLKIYRELFARKKENQSDISSEAAIDLLTGVIIQSMNEARYVGSGALSGDLVSSSGSLAESAAEGRLIGHYGLGLAFYTHFTSPIRRYADIMVHRQLLRALEATNTMSRMEDGNLKDIVSSVDAMNEQVEGGSEREEGNGEADVDNDDDLDFLDSLLEDVEDGLVMSSSPTQKDESSLQAIRNEASFDAAPKEEKNGDKTGEEVVPYSAAELHTISEHLNTMNRRSKSAQFACQKLFLCLYFVGKSEIHEGLVHSLKENGFWCLS